ncbi:Uncharacterized protein BP5553_08970 [Venustampulla echinocandica]|uniref:Uncharacterized protein n=1 Tax=Venustampulla echinocandica TaxID=2656787 RepID=A0A370TDK2_9HELO|nr:Uncharacterized protein BP5553_08970 [Venustampulla echinocandica]RDL32514.1 Uncharacterized protein BP5553_08970 [Venustampulla echinocandica]
MSSADSQGQRIQDNCEIIWGKGDYDIDTETDDYLSYWSLVRKDFGLEFGPPLTMTGLCNSSEHAVRELDRMLGVWARQIQSGQPMTKALNLEVFGGPNGQNKAVLEQFLVELEKRGTDSA